MATSPPKRTGVEGVGSVPSLRPELSPLRDACVEVTQREQEGLEFGLFGAHLERVLREVVERLMEVGLHAPRRLVGDLDGRLQDALWQVRRWLFYHICPRSQKFLPNTNI